MNGYKTLLVVSDEIIELNRESGPPDRGPADITLVKTTEVYAAANGRAKRLRDAERAEIEYALRWLACPVYEVCLDCINLLFAKCDTSSRFLCFNCRWPWRIRGKTKDEIEELSEEFKRVYPDPAKLAWALKNSALRRKNGRTVFLTVKHGKSEMYSIFYGLPVNPGAAKTAKNRLINQYADAGAPLEGLAGWKKILSEMLPLANALKDVPAPGSLTDHAEKLLRMITGLPPSGPDCQKEKMASRN